MIAWNRVETVLLDIDGTLEHYIDARDSIRVGVGWMQAKQNNDSLKSVREIRLGGDIVHNWEGGSIHPFVGAGLEIIVMNGADHVRSRQHEHVVVTAQIPAVVSEPRPAEILLRQPATLDHGAHGAVENEDPSFEKFR